MPRKRFGIGFARRGGGAAWTPASVTGFTYFVVDPTTCFTDAGGTTPAAVGDMVYTLVSSYGPACTVQQATGANRLILRQDSNGKYYLEAAATRFMDGSYSGGTGDIAMTLASAHRLTIATDACPFFYGTSVGSRTGFGLLANTRAAGKWSAEFAGGEPYPTDAATDINAEQNLICTKSPGAINTTTTLYRNGVAASSTGGASTGTPSLAVQTITLCQFGVFGLNFVGRIYGFGMCPSVLTAPNIALLDTFQRGLYTP